MKISTQTKAISNATNNNLNTKIHNEPEFRKTIVRDIDNTSLNRNKKMEFLRQIELERLKNFANIEKYESYNSAQISNIAAGLEAGVDISVYDDISNSAQTMALRRLILIFNKENKDNMFDLSLLNTNNNNKVALLFAAHKFNVKHPDNTIDLNILINEFNLNKAKEILKSHMESANTIKLPVTSVEIKPETKKKAPVVIEKNVKDMSYGELADLWNGKHPNAQINASLIYAQENKKMAEMIYVTSIYNLKFRNKKVSLNTFLQNSFTFEQKEEIFAGIKYNLKNDKNPIPFEKYLRNDIPADNMRIINKIMRLQAEYNVQADINYIIANYTDRIQLNDKYEELFKTKQN